MSNYNHAKDLEGQVLTLIEAIVPEAERATAAKSIFRRLFHEWVEGLDVGMAKYGTEDSAVKNHEPMSASDFEELREKVAPCFHTASHSGSCNQFDALIRNTK